MATIYASAPGTGSGGSGTSGSPYTGIHDAIHALIAAGAGSELLLKTGTYTPSMAWNTITWGSGSPGSLYTIRPETFTADTTRGIPGGTTSVIWRTTGGAAFNFGVAGAGYWTIRGIEFDATNLTAGTINYINHNYGNNNIEFRNCKFSNRAQTSAALVVHVDYANTGAQTTLRNNSVRYCWFTNAAAQASHDIYCRSSGNVFEHNLFASNTQRAAIQFFASNGTGYNVQQNTVRFNEFKDYGDVGTNNGNVLFGENCSRNYVYCNLFHDSPTRYAIDFHGGSGISGDSSDNLAAYNTIYNCLRGIIVGSATTGFTGTILKKNIAYSNGSTAAHNLVYNCSGTVKLGNSVDGTNPQFTDAGNDDYTLSASTPSGIRADSVLAGSPFDDVDYTGATRDATNPSMGAYEYDAASTPEPPINVFPNPGGYTVTKNTATNLTGLSVTQDGSLTTECWLSLDGNATWTDVDTSGGATSN